MKLAIITGVNGALGKAYANRFSVQEQFKCIGISRSEVSDKNLRVTYVENVDLLDAEKTRLLVANHLSLDNVSEVLLIHPVGKFKFEINQQPQLDVDGDGMDDEVYASNVITFKNIEGPLTEVVRQQGKITDLLLCGFGSVSDRYKIPLWLSYSRAKDILRQYISVRARQNGSNIHVKGVFVNVSSVNTGNENKLRPFADKTHWLEPEEIVDDSFPVFFQRRIRNIEMDVFNPIVGFDPERYYSIESVRERWFREMGA